MFLVNPRIKTLHCWYLALVLNLKPIQGNGFKQQFKKYCASLFLLLRRNDFKRFSLSLLSISLGRNLQFHKAGSLIIESLPLLKEILSSRLMKWIRRKYPESILKLFWIPPTFKRKHYIWQTWSDTEQLVLDIISQRRFDFDVLWNRLRHLLNFMITVKLNPISKNQYL